MVDEQSDLSAVGMEARELHGDLVNGRSLRRADNNDKLPTTKEGHTIAQFRRDDPSNPPNWPMKRKLFVLTVGILLVINSTLGSSISSSCGPFLRQQFHITSQEELVLPNSMYLLGYVFGPPVFSPLSELIGRKFVLQGAFLGFTAFTLASALAPNWPSLIVFRLLTGICASAPITVVGGLCADLFDDPVHRGRAVAVLVGGTTIAPVVGPIISGFVSPVSWRWVFWISLIVAAIVWPVLIFLPETFGPAILNRKAKISQRSDPTSRVIAPSVIGQKSTRQIVTITLARPIRLLREPIVLFCCTYLAFEYALFYIFFVAYPIVFQGIYGMSLGVATLPLLPIGIGAGLACVISVVYDGILRRASQREAPWTKIKEYRRLPLACLGGPLHVVALFWLGWSARSDVPWIVPTLAGLPFGLGVELAFISLLNYLTDAYNVYAASVMASSAFTRSIFAVLLPLGVNKMYSDLGVPWTFSLLGFISFPLAAAPFFLIRWGKVLRRKSRFCEEISQQVESMELQDRVSDARPKHLT